MRVPSVSSWLPLLRATWAAYQRHNSQWLAAALAYFAAFAVAPLIIVVVAIAGAFLHGHLSAVDEIYTRWPGPETVAMREIVAATLGQPRHGLIAQVAGWAFFAIAALGLFGSLQFALNVTWDVTPKKMGIWQTVRRRDVWVGAGITALLFVAGQFLLGLYLGRVGVGSAYGAFGSLVVFLLWANYSAQIVLFGAEFTHVYALHRSTLQAM